MPYMRVGGTSFIGPYTTQLFEGVVETYIFLVPFSIY